ncbi:hypothetical protein [Nocardioides sp. GY 10127]|uniref:hypothetical protein n=1 Tax=Nocardioides sp. GY 10127 TaxID=2569762 RepID=UPI0010A93544|nr:hypothetical protein [Nocardioides sp. GY 10127]TIC78802.1 hypothetical protein E8D37_19085 [Nocardioides sp. GY 10127]
MPDYSARPAGLDWDALTPTCSLCGKPSGSVDTETGLCQPCTDPISYTPTSAAAPGGPGDAARRPGPRRRYAQRDAHIVERYNAGDPVTTIATDQSMSPGAVRAVLDREGIQRRRTLGGNRIAEDRDPSIVDKVRRLYVDEHCSVEEAARRLGVGVSRVRSVMRRNGIEPRQTGGTAPMPQDVRDDIIRRYNAAEPAPAIAAAHGINPSTVYTVLRAAGVPTRKQATR